MYISTKLIFFFFCFYKNQYFDFVYYYLLHNYYSKLYFYKKKSEPHKIEDPTPMFPVRVALGPDPQFCNVFRASLRETSKLHF